MTDSVAVIIPTRGRNDLLDRAVTSVLAQDFPNIHVVIVDDNPVENRVKSDLKECSWLNDKRITIVENPAPLNAARARNLGLNATNARWITYLDDDDEYCPRKVSRQLSVCRDKRTQLALCGYYRKVPLRRCRRQTSTGAYQGLEVYRDAHPGTPFLMHRNDHTLRFDEQLFAHEDADFFYRAISHFDIKEVFVAAEPLVTVYQQVRQRVNTQSVASWQAQRRIYCRHYRRLDRPVRRLLFARMLLSRWKQSGSLGLLWKISFWLWKSEQSHIFRLLANAILFRVPFLRRFAIS